MQSKDLVIIGEGKLSIEELLLVSNEGAKVKLSDDKRWRESINSSARFLEDRWRQQDEIYGVTTGYGESCSVRVGSDLVEELPKQLVRFHGCGLGRVLSVPAARAVMIARLASLSRGFSGVRMTLLEKLCEFLNKDIIPVIPEEGSVGASGDLTPLSYVAAALCGEQDVFHKGKRSSAKEILATLDIEPYVLNPKEALAIMNGTSVMTGLASLAFERAQYTAKLAARITALAAEVIGGNSAHFSKELAATKPHPGQMLANSWILTDLGEDRPERRAYDPRLQERYSIRCAPHVIGVLLDSLEWIKGFIETEINSATDNPLIDTENEKFMHGGHFYGGHIAFAMDALKIAVANVADLLDRQLALLVDPHTNNGLPANLSGAAKERKAINHGLKAVQIGASAWTAEALKLTMPASVFSRSTECHNQDKVSMGTISARDCLRVLELTEQTSVATLLASRQGIALRLQRGELSEDQLSPQMQKMYKQLCQQIPFLDEDRPLENDLRKLVELMHEKAWELY